MSQSPCLELKYGMIKLQQKKKRCFQLFQVYCEKASSNVLPPSWVFPLCLLALLFPPFFPDFLRFLLLSFFFFFCCASSVLAAAASCCFRLLRFAFLIACLSDSMSVSKVRSLQGPLCFFLTGTPSSQDAIRI